MNKNYSQDKISFCDKLNSDIYIDKTWKSYYFRFFKIELDEISNFIRNLKDHEVYMIKPIISVNCRPLEPHVNLSKDFLITNESNPILITNFIIDQFDTFENDFDTEIDKYFLIIKYKLVTLNYKL